MPSDLTFAADVFPAEMFPRRPLLIAGPTASGKSAYAMARAYETPSLIINADSMQVYADLSILTARPTQTDMAGIPHRLYGHVDGALAYSTGQYARELSPVLAKAAAERLRPVIVGGTGLYFRAILEGLSPIPEIPAEIRASWRERQRAEGTAEVFRLLAARDPVMAARLKPNDPQRIVRALEVLEATGRSLAEWQAVPGRPLLIGEDCERVLVSPDREALFQRADSRFDAMMDAGALGEVERLLGRNLDAQLPVMRALGVPQLASVLDQTQKLPDAVEAAKQATRAYIKRQRTWLKRNMVSWNTYKSE